MTRLRDILRGYETAFDIDEVLYICPRPVVAKRITGLIYDLRVYRKVRVEPEPEGLG